MLKSGKILKILFSIILTKSLQGSYTPPRKHLPEITFPRKARGRNYIILNAHFPERALART